MTLSCSTLSVFGEYSINANRSVIIRELKAGGWIPIHIGIAPQQLRAFEYSGPIYNATKVFRFYLKMLQFQWGLNAHTKLLIAFLCSQRDVYCCLYVAVACFQPEGWCFELPLHPVCESRCMKSYDHCPFSCFCYVRIFQPFFYSMGTRGTLIRC